MPKKKTIGKVKKELDRVFSIYIRQKYMDHRGYVACVCCGVVKHWTEMQNGHYASRANYMTRYDEDNCWPCCMRCNIFKKGNYPAFTDFLLRKFSVTWLQNLVKRSTVIKKWTIGELEELLNFYKSKIKK